MLDSIRKPTTAEQWVCKFNSVTDRQLISPNQPSLYNVGRHSSAFVWRMLFSIDKFSTRIKSLYVKIKRMFISLDK